MQIGIVGAGLIGRLLAFECLQRGWKVTLFDQDARTGKNSCGWVAAGMIAPYSELESSELLLYQLGIAATALWPAILNRLAKPVRFHLPGTLVIAHPQDAQELTRFHAILTSKLSSQKSTDKLFKVEREKLESLVPDLSPSICSGFWLGDEGYIDNQAFFAATNHYFSERQVTWHEKTKVTGLRPYEVEVQNQRHTFDLVCDTRGLGAKIDWPSIRGVRGELIWLQAPNVQLNCVVRLLHPRYSIYISPRENHCYVVGATTIESEDLSPISVESMLELLSAAYTIHPGFAEARIINSLTQSRPCFPDQQPKISLSPGLLKINGLYRHGYLAGPAVIHEALRLFELGKESLRFKELLN